MLTTKMLLGSLILFVCAINVSAGGTQARYSGPIECYDYGGENRWRINGADCADVLSRLDTLAPGVQGLLECTNVLADGSHKLFLGGKGTNLDVGGTRCTDAAGKLTAALDAVTGHTLGFDNNYISCNSFGKNLITCGGALRDINRMYCGMEAGGWKGDAFQVTNGDWSTCDQNNLQYRSRSVTCSAAENYDGCKCDSSTEVDDEEQRCCAPGFAFEYSWGDWTQQGAEYYDSDTQSKKVLLTRQEVEDCPSSGICGCDPTSKRDLKVETKEASGSFDPYTVVMGDWILEDACGAQTQTKLYKKRTEMETCPSGFCDPEEKRPMCGWGYDNANDWVHITTNCLKSEEMQTTTCCPVEHGGTVNYVSGQNLPDSEFNCTSRTKLVTKRLEVWQESDGVDYFCRQAFYDRYDSNPCGCDTSKQTETVDMDATELFEKCGIGADPRATKATKATEGPCDPTMSNCDTDPTNMDSNTPTGGPCDPAMSNCGTDPTNMDSTSPPSVMATDFELNNEVQKVLREAGVGNTEIEAILAALEPFEQLLEASAMPAGAISPDMTQLFENTQVTDALAHFGVDVDAVQAAAKNYEAGSDDADDAGFTTSTGAIFVQGIVGLIFALAITLD